MNETPVITTFLDANVLYPALLRNILLRLASQNLFQARWSKQVHGEWMAALRRDRPDIPLTRIERTRHLMDTHFPEACVEGYEHLIAAVGLPDADDRHVLAAAIYSRARIIVTTNLRDFPDAAVAGFEIEAVHPDTFILRLLGRRQSEVIATLQRLRKSLRNPPQAAAELLVSMSRQGLTGSADALRPLIESLDLP